MLYLSICVYIYIYVDARIHILYMYPDLPEDKRPGHIPPAVWKAIEACLGDPPDLAKTGIQMVCFSTAYVVIYAVSTAFT